MSAIILVTTDVLHQHSTLRLGVDQALRRFSLRQVGIAVLAADDEAAEQARAALGDLPHLGIWVPADAREALPRPRLLLRCLRETGAEGPRSWLIAAESSLAATAGQAGLAGCVLVHGAVPPPEDLGLVVASADDLADAPRVMIPKGGGCWH